MQIVLLRWNIQILNHSLADSKKQLPVVCIPRSLNMLIVSFLKTNLLGAKFQLSIREQAILFLENIATFCKCWKINRIHAHKQILTKFITSLLKYTKKAHYKKMCRHWLKYFILAVCLFGFRTSFARDRRRVERLFGCRLSCHRNGLRYAPSLTVFWAFSFKHCSKSISVVTTSRPNAKPCRRFTCLVRIFASFSLPSYF